MSRIAQPATRSLNEPLGAGREQRRRSPDGCMLAFVRAPKSQLPGRGQIYLKMLPDGEPKRLTQDDLPKMSPRCFRRTARAIQTFTQRHLALSETHTFRPTLINEFRFGYYSHINPANDVDG